METMSFPAGAFCFPELNTRDVDGAKRFYGELFGWSAFDVPSAQGGYALMRLRGRDVAGIHRSSRPEPCWLSYVNVQSADRTAARAAELGGKDLVGPFDVEGIGRMLMVQDPAGATIAFWEPRGHIGAGIAGEDGSMVWNELVVHDVDAARDFYAALLGWTAVETRVPNGPYTIFKADDRSRAGLMPIQKEWGKVPCAWNVYFGVASCEESVVRARALGGRVVAGPMDVPGACRFAILGDPSGATFLVMQSP